MPRPMDQPLPAPQQRRRRRPPATGRRSDVFDPSQNPNAPGVPRPLGGMPNEPPPVVMADPPVGAPGGRGAGGAARSVDDVRRLPGCRNPAHRPSQGPLPAPPPRNLSATGAVASVAPPTDSPKDTYDLGYGYVLRKDYALAEDTFQAFLKKYPTDRRAADAQFWLGESLFQRQRYDAAAQAFLDLSTKHASHAKAPEALLRLGAVAGRDEAEGNVLRHARRGRPQVSESDHDREAGRRARAKACPLLTAHALKAAEVRSLFADLADHPALILAVSGGPDSTALLVARGALAQGAESAGRSSSPSPSTTACAPRRGAKRSP